MEKTDFKNISEVKAGMLVFDSYNEFGKKDFNFINGQSYNEQMCLCEIVDVTTNSVCVKINKHPLRIMKHDGGGESNPISHDQWYKFKREHEYEIAFVYRFKKLITT